MRDKRRKTIIPIEKLELPESGSVGLQWGGNHLRCWGPILAQHKTTLVWYEVYVFESSDPSLDLPRKNGWCLLPGVLCVEAGAVLAEAA